MSRRMILVVRSLILADRSMIRLDRKVIRAARANDGAFIVSQGAIPLNVEAIRPSRGKISLNLAATTGEASGNQPASTQIAAA